MAAATGVGLAGLVALDVELSQAAAADQDLGALEPEDLLDPGLVDDASRDEELAQAEEHSPPSQGRLERDGLLNLGLADQPPAHEDLAQRFVDGYADRILVTRSHASILRAEGGEEQARAEALAEVAGATASCPA